MRRTLGLPHALLVCAAMATIASCDKDTAAGSATPAEAPAAEGATEPAAADESPVDKEAEAKAKQEKQFNEAIARLEEQSKKKAERWTPELKAKVTSLTAKGFKNTKGALKQILASEHRAPGSADRDKFRHPIKTLTFFGLKPDMKVFEVGQGAGWYSEILAPLLAKNGKLYLATGDANAEDVNSRFAARSAELFVSSSGNLYEQVELVQQPAGDAPPTLGAVGSLDMVLVFRMLHNIHRFDLWDKYMPAIHAGLKDGGVLAVVQHRAAEGADPAESAKSGYLPQKWLVEKVEGYGFKLDKASELNANAKDTKDYEKGVWTLPPSYALGDKDKDKYTAVGESDRATLKFVKVAK